MTEPTPADLIPPEPDPDLCPAETPPAPTPCLHTAHQLAGWYSVYRPLCPSFYPRYYGEGTPCKYPPDQEDLDVLDAVWKRRLRALRDAGAKPLAGRVAYERARACRPHAFAYAGEGKPCRFWFCPYCRALEAAEAFERVLRTRVRLKEQPGSGLALYQYQFVAEVEVCRYAVAILLSRRPKRISRIKGARLIPREAWFEPWRTSDNLIRTCIHPLDRYWVDAGKVKLVARVIAPVSVKRRDTTRRMSDTTVADTDPRVVATAATKPDVPRWPPLGETGYLIRPTPVAEAQAAGTLLQYPAGLITGAIERAVEILNLAAGLRQSATRGVFRTASAVRPGATRVYVPTTIGEGLVGPLLLGHPDPPESLAARGFARELGLTPADTFAAVGEQLGWPIHWLGAFEPTFCDMAFGEKKHKNRPNQRRLTDLVADRRPKRPGRHHLLVLACSAGYMVFWTTGDHECDLLNASWDKTRLTRNFCFGIRLLRRILYFVAPVATFRYFAMETRVTGPRAIPAVPVQPG